MSSLHHSRKGLLANYVPLSEISVEYPEAANDLFPKEFDHVLVCDGS